MYYFVAWLIAACFYSFDFFLRVMPNVMVPELKAEFIMSKAQIGYVSAYYYYAYAIMQIPAGILLDKFGSKMNLIVASSCILLGNMIATTTDSINLLYFSRVIIGIGSSFAFLACVRIANNNFPKKYLAILVGVTSLFGTLGALLAGKPLAGLLEQFCWRNLTMKASIVSGIFTFAFIMFPKEVKHTNNNSPTNAFKEILINCSIVRYSLIGCLMVMPLAGFSELWGTEFTSYNYLVNKKLAASLVSFAYIGVAIGSSTIGIFAKTKLSRLRILSLMSIAAFICLIIFIYVKVPIYIYAILQIIFGFATSAMLLCFTINIETIPKHQSLIVGLTNTVVTLGSVMSQPMIGYLLDKNHNYSLAFMPIIIGSGLAIYLTTIHDRCK